MPRLFIFMALLLSYAGLFLQQERQAQSIPPHLPFPMPVVAEKALLGYLRQLGGEMHFIQTAIYIGSYVAHEQNVFDVNSVASNLDAAAELNPPFLDTYYYSQSMVASQGDESARRTNEILKKGIAALPEDWVIPFFMGFNHFHHLNEPVEAASAIQLSSKLPGAPSWLGHLASVLSAKGGDIYTGLVWLRAMREGENDELVRKGYDEDIADFEMALRVQKAVAAFNNRYGRAPAALDELAPEFLSSLPDFKGNFILKWEPPVLRMVRPEVK